MSISDSAYTNEQILGMEKEILGKLEWNLTVATPYVFLVRFIKATVPSDKEVTTQLSLLYMDILHQTRPFTEDLCHFLWLQLENMAFYLAENGLMQYQIVKSFCPSLIAAAAVYAALYNMGRTPFWTETLQHYTGYSEEQLK